MNAESKKPPSTAPAAPSFEELSQRIETLRGSVNALQPAVPDSEFEDINKQLNAIYIDIRNAKSLLEKDPALYGDWQVKHFEFNPPSPNSVGRHIEALRKLAKDRDKIARDFQTIELSRRIENIKRVIHALQPVDPGSQSEYLEIKRQLVAIDIDIKKAKSRLENDPSLYREWEAKEFQFAPPAPNSIKWHIQALRKLTKDSNKISRDFEAKESKKDKGEPEPPIEELSRDVKYIKRDVELLQLTDSDSEFDSIKDQLKAIDTAIKEAKSHLEYDPGTYGEWQKEYFQSSPTAPDSVGRGIQALRKLAKNRDRIAQNFETMEATRAIHLLPASNLAKFNALLTEKEGALQQALNKPRLRTTWSPASEGGRLKNELIEVQAMRRELNKRIDIGANWATFESADKRLCAGPAKKIDWKKLTSNQETQKDIERTRTKLTNFTSVAELNEFEQMVSVLAKEFGESINSFLNQGTMFKLVMQPSPSIGFRNAGSRTRHRENVPGRALRAYEFHMIRELVEWRRHELALTNAETSPPQTETIKKEKTARDKSLPAPARSHVPEVKVSTPDRAQGKDLTSPQGPPPPYRALDQNGGTQGAPGQPLNDKQAPYEKRTPDHINSQLEQQMRAEWDDSQPIPVINSETAYLAWRAKELEAFNNWQDNQPVLEESTYETYLKAKHSDENVTRTGESKQQLRHAATTLNHSARKITAMLANSPVMSRSNQEQLPLPGNDPLSNNYLAAMSTPGRRMLDALVRKTMPEVTKIQICSWEKRIAETLTKLQTVPVNQEEQLVVGRPKSGKRGFVAKVFRLKLAPVLEPTAPPTNAAGAGNSTRRGRRKSS